MRKYLSFKRLVLVCAVFILYPINYTQAENKDIDDLFAMSLEQLMEMPVEVTGSLTDTSRRVNPSTVTTITADDIRISGARSLDELLDIYIPNLMRMADFFEFKHVGLRGVMSDRDDKYLILVNGRVMNEHTHYGALSERDLPMLMDIHHVDVIRGPGSALYGPGAIAMVVNIITDNALTFQGTEALIRQGAVETFTSAEVKHGQKLSKKSGYFLYASVSDYDGASVNNSPISLGRHDMSGIFWGGWGRQDYDSQPRFHQAWRNQPKYKVHAQYTNGDFDSWLRYTKGGMHNAARSNWVADSGNEGTGYQQLTFFTSYKQQINPACSIDYSFSYDFFDLDRIFWTDKMSHLETELTGKVILKFKPSDKHSLAVGCEFSHENFGRNSWGWPNFVPLENRWNAQMPKWSSNMYSGLGEYQWNINDVWTAFFNMRIDEYTHVDTMYSPRFALVHTPNIKDTFKFSYSRSARTGLASDIKKSYDDNGSKTEPEQIDTFELRAERQQSDHLWLASSVFYNTHSVTGYDVGAGGNWGATLLGKIQTIGAEIQATYKTERTRLIISHGFTKLLNFRALPGTQPFLTAEPYGYGSDLANWSNHISKFHIDHKVTNQFSIDGSARIYWGYPGFEDWGRWTEEVRFAADNIPRISDSISRGSFFVNLGAEYRVNENIKIRLDGHDLLGLIDKDMNKQIYGFGYGQQYRSTPASITLSAYCKIK